MTATVESPAVTENSAGNSEVTETPAETTEQVFARLNVDETDQLLFAKTVKTINDYNSAMNELKSLSGDLAEVTESVRNSDDSDIVSLRERVEKAQTALKNAQERLDNLAKEKAQAKIAENTDSEKVESLKAQTDKYLKRIKATQNALVADYGDDIKSAFPTLANQRGSGNATGRGAGVARPRNFTVKVDGNVATLPNASGDKVSSFSAAAKVIGAKTTDVQAPFFASEGTNPEGWIPGKVVSYNITHDGKTYKVEAMKNKDNK